VFLLIAAIILLSWEGVGNATRACDLFATDSDIESAVARSAGFFCFFPRVPGVPLRSTPGFMLTPASRVKKMQRLDVMESVPGAIATGW
jgi:hypothetical protein